jgi:DNA-binding NarL/FixJ family response regulator
VGSAHSVLAIVEAAAGRLGEARAALDPIIRLIEGADPVPFVPGLARAMGYLLLRAGQPSEAIAWFRGSRTGMDGAIETHLAPQTLTGLAAAFREIGDTGSAAAACERALAAARQIGMPRVAADALEQSALLVTLSDPARAEDLHHEALAVRASHHLWLFCADSLEALASIAARSEPSTEAVRLLAACDRARERMGYPGMATAPASDPAARTELRTALGTKAYDTAWAQGRALSLRDAVEYARRARGRRGRPSSGWASLTPTEQSVVRLAAEGLSNPAIGSRLFMSRSTVKTHLSHIYAKLGITNRTELATLAHAHLTRR